MLYPFRKLGEKLGILSNRHIASIDPRRRLLTLEQLESRALMSVVAGDTYINTTTVRDQYDVALAAAPDGRSVAVWTHNHTRSDTDIFAQRFDGTGTKVGTEIRVATTNKAEFQPDVAMDDDGDFIVTWVEQDSSGDFGIKAQAFVNTGAKTGSVIVVADTARDEHSPSIASDAAGNFVVSWTLDYYSDQSDIRARRYHANGGPNGSTLVVTSSYDNETNSDVARSPDGRFAITYQTSYGNGDVILKRYSATGNLASTQVLAAGLNRQTNPRVTMDSNANVITAWQEFVVDDWDIRARRVTETGGLGAIWSVSGGIRNEMLPDLAVRRDGSAFVVTHYDSYDRTANVTEMSISGTVRHRQLIERDVIFASAPVVFGNGGSYHLAYERQVSGRGTDLLRRRGLLS